MANIKDNLFEMKNKSELIVDMAYSAVFTQDKRIVKRVEVAYEEIERLQEDTLKLLFKVSIPDEERIVMMEFADGIKDIANSAVRIANLALAKKLPTVLKDIFRDHEFKKI